jgi:hypothetical protein
VTGLDEIASGIAAVLAGVTPEPLTVQLRGQSTGDAEYLLRAVLRECGDAEIPSRRVVVDEELFTWLSRPGAGLLPCTLAGGGEAGEVRFFRQVLTR